MGIFIKKQINPNKQNLQFQKSSSLLQWSGTVSRANFKFIRILDNYGFQNQSILWLACNINNQDERYFVRQIDKYKVYNHKKIQSTLNQLHLLIQNNNPYLIKVNFAFQDYQNLYLVSEAIQSQSLQSIMNYHQFSQDQTRYIVLALISIIEYVHSKGFAITDLSPKEVHINKINGSIKMIKISNPTQIDTYCSSNIVEEICPYSAPQILLRNIVLAECDFYSLGLIVYELMTQTKIFSKSQEMNSKYSRSDILNENIQIKKYKIPEDWKADVADFLIKLLIKNPALRLGRYGSYQVKNHHWLKEFDMEQGYIKGIKFQMRNNETNPQKISENKEVKEIVIKKQFISDHFFQQLFSVYKYQKVEYKEQQIKNMSERNTIQQEKTSIYFNESNIGLKKISL